MPLMSDKVKHTFKVGATFDNAYELYKFDSRLRKLIASELEKIEAELAKVAKISLQVDELAETIIRLGKEIDAEKAKIQIAEAMISVKEERINEILKRYPEEKERSKVWKQFC